MQKPLEVTLKSADYETSRATGDELKSSAFNWTPAVRGVVSRFTDCGKTSSGTLAYTAEQSSSSSKVDTRSYVAVADLTVGLASADGSSL